MDTKIKDLIDSLDLTQETKNEIKLQNQNKIKIVKKEMLQNESKHIDIMIERIIY